MTLLDRWTIFMITLDGLAAIQPDSLSLDTLNLAEKTERQIASCSLPPAPEESHQRDHLFPSLWLSGNC